MLILAIVTVILAIISLGLGRFSIAAPQVIGMMIDKFLPFVHVEQAWTTQQAALFFGVRLPRIVLVLMVGASLSLAGATFQGVFQNPLVSPDLLGASQGAAFGACLAILFLAGPTLLHLLVLFASLWHRSLSCLP